MRIILSILILTFSGPTHAEYFFTTNDTAITECIFTPLRGVSQLKFALESAFGVQCTAEEDNAGTVIVMCKKSLTNITIVTRTENLCKKRRSNMGN